jgi:type I restriction enzyme S subunit
MKKAYKRTEIGVIPVDWEVRKLGEIVDRFINGGTPSTQNSDFWKGNIPWITCADILNQKVGEIRRYITKEAVKNSSTNVIKKGNLLLVTRTGVGKLAIAPFDISISQDFTGIYVNELLANYLFFVFDFNKTELQSQNQGTSIKGITRETLAETSIPLPPLPEQKAIAEVLSDTDNLIQALEKRIAKKRLIKQGAMQKLLTPKDNWEVKKLGEIGTFKNGINKSSEDFCFGYPFVNLMDVFGKTTIYTNEHFGLINSNEAERKMYELKKGDVLFIRSSVKHEGVGLTCLIKNNLKDTVFSGFIIRYRDNGVLCNEYKEHCFYNSHFRNKLIGSSTVSANTNINQEALKNLTISFPISKAEQTHIATILSDMDSEIEALENKRAKYQLIKQGLMQNLLTGKIRLI